MELGRYVDGRDHSASADTSEEAAEATRGKVGGVHLAKPWKMALAGLAICLVLASTACSAVDPARSGGAATQNQQAAQDASQPSASSPTQDEAAPQSETESSADAEAAADTKAATDAEATEPPIQTVSATVIRVVDGDTAWFRLASGGDEKVRFIGIDTPESTIEVEPYGKEASSYTRKALPVGKRVYLEQDVESRDKYGRLLAYVWLEQPSEVSRTELRHKLFNARLAIDGYAQQMTIPPNVKYATYFKGFAAEARDADRGLWDAAVVEKPKPKPKAPAPAKKASATYIANRNTMKFHYAYCSSVSLMNESNKVKYSSRTKAVADGYIPCKRCNP